MCFVESVVFSHIVFLQNLLHISYRIDHILSGSGNNVNLFSSCVSAEILRQEVDSRIGHIVTGNKYLERISWLLTMCAQITLCYL